MTCIIEARTAARIAQARVLFTAYAEALNVDLSFQQFDAELRDLPGDYVPPKGNLWLALDGVEAVGCVAVHACAEGDVAEMKRLYVMPSHQGNGLGQQLAHTAITFACYAGYRAIRLDTLPSMQAAQGLYARLGFHDIPAYRHNPVAGTRYMELTLN